MCTCRRYLAPELLNSRGSDAGLDKADMFALGATLYELATGSPLPTGGERYAAIRHGQLMMMPCVSVKLQGLIKVRAWMLSSHALCSHRRSSECGIWNLSSTAHVPLLPLSLDSVLHSHICSCICHGCEPLLGDDLLPSVTSNSQACFWTVTRACRN